MAERKKREWRGWVVVHSNKCDGLFFYRKDAAERWRMSAEPWGELVRATLALDAPPQPRRKTKRKP